MSELEKNIENAIEKGKKVADNVKHDTKIAINNATEKVKEGLDILKDKTKDSLD